MSGYSTVASANNISLIVLPFPEGPSCCRREPSRTVPSGEYSSSFFEPCSGIVLVQPWQVRWLPTRYLLTNRLEARTQSQCEKKSQYEQAETIGKQARVYRGRSLTILTPVNIHLLSTAWQRGGGRAVRCRSVVVVASCWAKFTRRTEAARSLGRIRRFLWTLGGLD